MARPLKDGVDYWPFSVQLLDDKKIKLIRAEFGSKGAYIAICLLNEIYKDNGYYKKWDMDDCYLMSEGVCSDCSPELIGEVLQGCFRRSLFDKRVFDAFGVLTSAGVQRQFLKIVGSSRQDIPIFKEYFLLNVSDKKDVAESVLKKLTFKSVSSTDNAVKSTDNSIKDTDNAESKEKEKVKKSKEEYKALIFSEPEFTEFIEMRKLKKKPLTSGAKKRLANKLEEIAPNDIQKQKQILMQSTDNGWTDVYPLKGESNGATEGYTAKGIVGQNTKGDTGTERKRLGNVL